MSQPIGIRLPDEILREIDKVSKREIEDRSTVIRRLILLGYSTFRKQKAAEEYTKGIITLSEAAKQADITLWEMEKFLVEQGYKSEYSIEDLADELRILDK